MEPVIELIDIHSSYEAFQNHMEGFEIWGMTRKDVYDDKIMANFFMPIGYDTYNSPNNLAFSDKSISPAYTTVKEPVSNHVNFGCHERAIFHNTVRQNNQNVTEFILGLQKQAVKYNLRDRLHVQMCDRLVVGIKITKCENRPHTNAEVFLTTCLKCSAQN
ncbi:uncharacterized protein Smp_201080 [Schistosoma mansoni]|uniref:uncharacterized protein n=1 Tax=Schistosoma mansoni TaxID=6183 RepID=UPI00022DC149|nr:uncharacterized protein Smp_201080 [Schistosoma mansoni]|eukprot:XP_018648964.1 uncharacterized protein Smp_201080 [Schistosoma mansoni]